MPGAAAQNEVVAVATSPVQVQAHVGGWLKLAGPMTELCNPADTREAVAVLGSVEEGAVAEATARAGSASARWARTSPLARGEILRRAADHLVAASEEIAVAMTRETGKIILESRARSFAQPTSCGSSRRPTVSIMGAPGRCRSRTRSPGQSGCRWAP